MKTCCDTHQNFLTTIYKIRFYGEIWQIIPKLSLLPLFIWSTEFSDVLKMDSKIANNAGPALWESQIWWPENKPEFVFVNMLNFLLTFNPI